MPRLGLFATLAAAPFVLMGFLAGVVWTGMCGGFQHAMKAIDDYSEGNP